MKMTARLPVRIISDRVGQEDTFMGTMGGMKAYLVNPELMSGVV